MACNGKKKHKQNNTTVPFILIRQTMATIMKAINTVYIKTDKRNFTFDFNLGILQKHFPRHGTNIIDKPLAPDTKTQTKIYGDKTPKFGEVDIIKSTDNNGNTIMITKHKYVKHWHYFTTKYKRQLFICLRSSCLR